MRFGQKSVEIVKGAATKLRHCGNCENAINHVLMNQPSGVGFSLSFSKRPFCSTHRAYGLVCPICTWGFEISKDEAQALIRKGKSQ
jgi:hypothetical protein